MKEKLAVMLKKLIIKLTYVYTKLENWDKVLMKSYVENAKKVSDCTPNFKSMSSTDKYWNYVQNDIEKALSITRMMNTIKEDTSKSKKTKTTKRKKSQSRKTKKS